jgi:hydroxyacylglutathione hydrolase
MGRNVVEVATGVLVTHSRRDVTASTILVEGTEAVLIDPAWDPDELDGLAEFLSESGLTVAAGFATHAHQDHLLWHPSFGEVPRWASPAAAQFANAHRAELLESLGPDWPDRLAPLVGTVEALEQEHIPWSGSRAEVVVHNGHAAGHAAVWLAASGALLAGDMFSDVELPLAEDTGLDAYDEALETLRPYVEKAAILIPGHGLPTASPMRRWHADRRYLDDVRMGRPVIDTRLASPGMKLAHAANLALR